MCVYIYIYIYTNRQAPKRTKLQATMNLPLSYQSIDGSNECRHASETSIDNSQLLSHTLGAYHPHDITQRDATQ